MALEFTTAKRRRQPVPFTLDGRAFSFDPPKNAVMVMPVLDAGVDAGDNVMLKAAFDWLGAGLPEEDVEHLISRLRDPEDDFDIEQIGDLIKGVSEEISGRPTT